MPAIRSLNLAMMANYLLWWTPTNLPSFSWMLTAGQSLHRFHQFYTLLAFRKITLSLQELIQLVLSCKVSSVILIPNAIPPLESIVTIHYLLHSSQTGSCSTTSQGSIPMEKGSFSNIAKMTTLCTPPLS